MRFYSKKHDGQLHSIGKVTKRLYTGKDLFFHLKWDFYKLNNTWRESDRLAATAGLFYDGAT